MATGVTQEVGGPGGPLGTGPAAMEATPAVLLQLVKQLPWRLLPVLPLLLLL